MASIVYELGNNLYINLTNRCPCACEFCIRNNSVGVGSAENLWLESEPSADDVIEELSRLDLSRYGEVVFCGYGEPTCALDVMLSVAKFLKTHGIKNRLNTNGLGNLINSIPVAHLLAELIDSVSISLNAPDAKRYAKLCRPEFGEAAFGAMMDFAAECLKYIPEVTLTVVDTIPQNEIDECRLIAESVNVPLRIRSFM